MWSCYLRRPCDDQRDCNDCGRHVHQVRPMNGRVPGSQELCKPQSDGTLRHSTQTADVGGVCRNSEASNQLYVDKRIITIPQISLALFFWNGLSCIPSDIPTGGSNLCSPFHCRPLLWCIASCLVPCLLNVSSGGWSGWFLWAADLCLSFQKSVPLIVLARQCHFFLWQSMRAYPEAQFSAMAGFPTTPKRSKL